MREGGRPGDSARGQPERQGRRSSFDYGSQWFREEHSGPGPGRQGLL